MKIERIGINRIKVTVSSEDLSTHGLSFESFAVDSPRVQDFFWHLIRRAQCEADFSIEEGKVIIEALPLRGEGLVIFLTKPDASSPFEEARYRRVRYRVKAGKTATPKDAVLLYQFDSFEDLCALCRVWRHMGERSSLYALADTYILAVSFARHTFDEKYARTQLMEFAKPASALSVPYLEEHAKKICDGDAIASVLRYF